MTTIKLQPAAKLSDVRCSCCGGTIDFLKGKCEYCEIDVDLSILNDYPYLMKEFNELKQKEQERILKEEAELQYRNNLKEKELIAKDNLLNQLVNIKRKNKKLFIICFLTIIGSFLVGGLSVAFDSDFLAVIAGFALIGGHIIGVVWIVNVLLAIKKKRRINKQVNDFE